MKLSALKTSPPGYLYLERNSLVRQTSLQFTRECAHKIRRIYAKTGINFAVPSPVFNLDMLFAAEIVGYRYPPPSVGSSLGGFDSC
jgi:hypothetical protein